MSLTRRNVAAVGDVKPPRAGSIWEDEANEYWKEMEPAKRRRRISKYAACVLLVLAAVGGTFFCARTAWSQLSVAGLRDRWLSSAAEPTMTASADIKTGGAANGAAGPGKGAAAPLPAAETFAPSPSLPPSQMAENPAFINNPAAVDLLRARCRVRGVQTRWHEETCRKLCIRYSRCKELDLTHSNSVHLSNPHMPGCGCL